MGITLSAAATSLRQLHQQESQPYEVYTAVVFVYGALGERGSSTKAHVFIHKGLMLFGNEKTEILGGTEREQAWCVSMVHLCHNDENSLLSEIKQKLNMDCSSIVIGLQDTDVVGTNISLSFTQIEESADEDVIKIKAAVKAKENHVLTGRFDLWKYPADIVSLLLLDINTINKYR